MVDSVMYQGLIALIVILVIVFAPIVFHLIVDFCVLSLAFKILKIAPLDKRFLKFFVVTFIGRCILDTFIFTVCTSVASSFELYPIHLGVIFFLSVFAYADLLMYIFYNVSWKKRICASAIYGTFSNMFTIMAIFGF